MLLKTRRVKEKFRGDDGEIPVNTDMKAECAFVKGFIQCKRHQDCSSDGVMTMILIIKQDHITILLEIVMIIRSIVISDCYCNHNHCFLNCWLIVVLGSRLRCVWKPQKLMNCHFSNQSLKIIFCC